MTGAKWHPRGEPTWPDWRKAEPGVTRVEHVGSGHRGTFVRWPVIHPGRKNPGHAVVDWDPVGRGDAIRSRVIAYAFTLRPIEGDR